MKEDSSFNQKKENHKLRTDNYLSNYAFFSNSIDFRIVSSKAIEQFKNSQTFQLNQIANGKFHFNKDRKEILLLKYDMWTKWIMEIENYLIEMSGKTENSRLSEDDVDFIIGLCDKTTKKYRDIMQTNSEYFDYEFALLWDKIHELTYDIMIFKIKETIGMNFCYGFSKIANLLIDIMRYTLIEIHEINGLYQYFHDHKNDVENEEENKKNVHKLPFIIYTNLDKVCKQLSNKHLIINRLITYKEFFEINELYIKNYSDEQFDQEIFDQIEDLGIKINYRMNF